MLWVRAQVFLHPGVFNATIVDPADKQILRPFRTSTPSDRGVFVRLKPQALGKFFFGREVQEQAGLRSGGGEPRQYLAGCGVPPEALGWSAAFREIPVRSIP